MTKQNFIALADAIREHTYNDTTVSHEFTDGQLEVLADFCQAQNPNFNRDRWLGYIAGTNGKNGGAR